MTPPSVDAYPRDSETINILRNRRSIRKYASTPVTDEHVEAILSGALRSPTSSNLHAYSVLVVRDPETKAKLAVPCGNQKHIIECPVFLAFCADLTRIESAVQRNGHDIENNNLELGLVATIDASLVGMAAYVAAESLGIHGVMIGAMRNKPEEIADILGLPNRVYAVFGMCLGYPAEAPKQKPRMPVRGIVHHEKYDAEAALGIIDPYDAELKSHYDSIGKETNANSWTHDVDAKFASRPRDGLRAALKKRGFDFA